MHLILSHYRILLRKNQRIDIICSQNSIFIWIKYFENDVVIKVQFSFFRIIFVYCLFDIRSTQQIFVSVEVTLYFKFGHYTVFIDVHGIPEGDEFVVAVDFAISVGVPVLPETFLAAPTGFIEAFVVVVDFFFAELPYLGGTLGLEVFQIDRVEDSFIPNEVEQSIEQLIHY